MFIIDSYIRFLRYCLHESMPVPSIKEIDWAEYLKWAEQQSIVGVVFEGIKNGGPSINIPKEDLLNWIGYTQLIEGRNRLLNRRCVELSSYLKLHELDACILKGQGNALLYPNPMYRSSGDIDVWVKGKSIKEVIAFSKRHNPKGKACYHHVDYGSYDGVEVEIHYRPTFMNNLLANKRLQKWIDGKKEEQFKHVISLSEEIGTICCPTWEFNVVFQLSHIYRHVIQGGIGLRQIIDYYYLLKSEERSKNEGILETLRYLGLEEIAGTVMWVLKDILGLSDEYLVAPVDERRGQFLYEEIMQGGNFGYYDKRVKHGNSALQRNLNRLKQDMRLVRYFPSECLWEPVFRVYHFFWRLAH